MSTPATIVRPPRASSSPDYVAQPAEKRETLCILCGTNAQSELLYPRNITEEDLNPLTFSARRLPDRLHETILRCRGCGLVYPAQLLSPILLSHLYRESRCTYTEEESHIRRTYMRYLRRLQPLLSRQRRPLAYLDIGCGNGFMLSAAKEGGFDDVWGVEPSSHASSQADPAVRSRILQGLFSLPLLAGRRFDAISCFQTLDHIPSPARFVADCLAALKPGGAALFINHNITSWTARLFGERCPMIDIEHTFLHTPHTMRQLFSQAGFQDIQVFPVRNDYPLHYWLHLLPGRQSLKLPLIAALRKMGLGNIVIPLYAGNMGLIAKCSLVR